VFGEQPSAAKWNILGTNDASFNDGTGIADGAVTPEKLLAGNGTSWVWQTWTHNIQNFTVGTGGSAGVTAVYTRVGKIVFFKLQGRLGTSGFSVSSGVTFTLPVEAATPIFAVNGTTQAVECGGGSVADHNTNLFRASVFLNTTTTGIVTVNRADATYVQPLQSLSNTVPMTWAANDSFYVQGYYEAA
jgi:hypothetical protein